MAVLILLVAAISNAGGAIIFHSADSALRVASNSIHAYSYDAPEISGYGPSPLQTDKTKRFSVAGRGFFKDSVILVNGKAVGTTYQTYGHIYANIFVPDDAIGSISIQVHNTKTGGGGEYSNVIHVPIKPKSLQVEAYNSAATANPGIVLLGQQVQFFDVITSGPGDASATWSINGAGSITSAGLYTAPVVLPSSNRIAVTARLRTNPAVTASKRLLIEYPVPAITNTLPAQLGSGRENTVTLFGSGFTPATTFTGNGARLQATYLSPSSMVVKIYTSSGQSGSVWVQVKNPTPRGGTGNSFAIPVDSPSSVNVEVTDAPGHLIPENFLGFSHEWSGINWMLGYDSSINGVNYIYRQLIDNLKNGTDYPFFIRIGGNSTDDTGEPNSSTVVSFVDMAKAENVQFALGVNMASDRPSLARNQAKFFAENMPANSLAAIELGNEPDNYGEKGDRRNPYTITNYLSDYTEWGDDILPLLSGPTRLMGPGWASPKMLQEYLGRFEVAEGGKTSIISQHLYGGYGWERGKISQNYLLTPAASTVGPEEVSTGVQIAHQRGQKFRIGEINSLDAGGMPGVSNAFESALWAIDVMFEYAKVGVDGVNWHGNVSCYYCAFTFANASVASTHPYTLQKVAPLYYGMLFFQQAASNNARLLPVGVNTGANVKVWATKDQSGTVHVMIINKDENFSGNVQIKLEGYGAGQLTRLAAPSYKSTDGVTIAGQTFDSSIDGKPLGTRVTEPVESDNGGIYTVSVQPTSAALLTLN